MLPASNDLGPDDEAAELASRTEVMDDEERKSKGKILHVRLSSSLLKFCISVWKSQKITN